MWFTGSGKFYWIFCTCVACFLPIVKGISMSQEQRQKRTDDLLNKLAHFEMTIPHQVDKTGLFQTFDVSNPRSNRGRRDTSKSDHQQYPETVFYNISGFGHHFLLHLKKNKRLVTDAYSVEIRNRSHVTEHSVHKHRGCHYEGYSQNHGGSRCFLSNCHGLVGLIRIDSEDFMVEPLWNQSHSPEQGHVHVIYRRSDLSLGHVITDPGCGLHDNFDVQKSHRKKLFSHHGNRKISKKARRNRHCQKKMYTETEKQFSFKHRRRKHCKIRRRKRKKTKEKLTNSIVSNAHTSPRHPRVITITPPVFMPETADTVQALTSETTKNDNSGRAKRSLVSEEHYVETLVVADKMMVQYHGKANIESYVLSIMNVVAQLFHDASIGNAINIVVTRLVLLEEDQDNLTLNYHADQSLDSFCRWQQTLNTTAAAQNTPHHDNAVLLTGYDICTYKNSPCGTLGLAPVEGMCEENRSCSISEDIGLAAAFTVAHEMGHNFGMQHDGYDNECGSSESQEPAGIMAAQLTKDTQPFYWSSCSRQYVTEFLDSEKSECLVNRPQEQLLQAPRFRRFPPTAMDIDEQCVLQFGTQSSACKPEEVCQELWCLNSKGKCRTNSIPAAEGTICSLDTGDRGWCYRGTCRHPDYRPEPQNGQWGEWSSWGECTRTCGLGVSSSYRRCDDPEPRHGGRYCVGERKRYRSCVHAECPDNVADFREVQCAGYNKRPFRGRYYSWRAFAGVLDKPCALNCIADGFNFYTERAKKVIDGTKCYPDSMDICINGKCQHVGCDGVIGSNATEDHCRICNGNGASCQTITGHFRRALPQGSYYEVVKIPQGAVHVHVRESTDSPNYLALKAEKGNYLINGEWTIDWPRKFSVAGTVFDYEREPNKPEVFKAIGPLLENVVVMILMQGEEVGIEYEYNIARRVNEHDVNAYTWMHLPWSPCSHPCGEGSTVAEAVCVQKYTNTTVPHELCSPQPQPNNFTRSCNTHACSPAWSVGNWSACSASCGAGRQQRRPVQCTQRISQQEVVILPPEECQGEQPSTSLPCSDVPCPAIWFADRWSECSAECGTGTKRRTVYCMSNDNHRYLPDVMCSTDSRPPDTESCVQRSCPQPTWRTGQWGECSARCGTGRQSRRVVCRTYQNNRATGCDPRLRPPRVKECTETCDAPPSPTDCVDQDKAQFCPLVEKYRVCDREYFYRMCCRTCVISGQRTPSGRSIYRHGK